jgi:hypothetical protein
MTKRGLIHLKIIHLTDRLTILSDSFDLNAMTAGDITGEEADFSF